MTPADIASSPELRAGLARRLAEVGLLAPDLQRLRLVPPAKPAEPADEPKAA